MAAVDGLQVISIHALRKESDDRYDCNAVMCEISIHALRKESDKGINQTRGDNNISIHALRKESDGQWRARSRPRPNFNPRSP